MEHTHTCSTFSHRCIRPPRRRDKWIAPIGTIFVLLILVNQPSLLSSSSSSSSSPSCSSFFGFLTQVDAATNTIHSDTSVLANDARLIVINVNGYPGPIAPPLVPDFSELNSAYTMDVGNYITQVTLAANFEEQLGDSAIISEHWCRSSLRNSDHEPVFFDL
jgi:hypothetical protein